ncbi:type IX secretion system PorP/SprF family membrane protein [Maribacter caenipelagi]|uniref:Type IX secretion system PorP/SprF family membrane protein n=1 Tax=Maribacter caenipelagi TaxID=1447781 RepID=A0A4R7D2H1_9FLAO|nr:PorP/SprF family type IX secretion system membrane protein [Maribacter caenipelagi]TDS14251.1 type IX secretion system PorP/SprF family membrane protein [Maribacter caenipelagi]
MESPYKINSFLIALFLLALVQTVKGQETNANLGSSSTYHNQLFFNRFFINPTFSLVRENKSYLNILHRNQYATFDDNSQNYFLGFSNKLNDHTAVGIGVYSQWSGVVQEFGFNANYASAVRLGEKSVLTFGTNVTYFNQGLDKNRIVVGEDDPKLADARKESKIAIQPGMNLSLGKFDFGFYAEDLFKYNQTTNEFLTELSTKSVKASVQYTHSFEHSRGLFTDARLMPMAQVGQNYDGSLYYFGSLLLDMPNYGWLQATVDEEYGVAAGVGFNLSEKMSLGYLMEKDLSSEDANLGWNHEITLAYKFKDDDLAISVADNSSDNQIDNIVRNYEEQIAHLIEERDNARKSGRKRQDASSNTASTASESSLAYENKIILDELILRQDSIEIERIAAFEERFELIVRMLRNDIDTTIKSSLQDFSVEENTSYASNDLNDDAIDFITEPADAFATASVSTATSTAAAEKASRRANFKELPSTRDNFKELPVKMLVDSDVIDMNSGYYVIANVYSQTKYMNAFMKDLRQKGLNPKQFYNKENGLYYVYLADYDYKNDAQMAASTNLNGKYNQEKWIMQVNETTATASNTFEDDDISRE